MGQRGWGQEGREGEVGQRACGIDRGFLEGEVGQGGKGGTENECRTERWGAGGKQRDGEWE